MCLCIYIEVNRWGPVYIEVNRWCLCILKAREIFHIAHIFPTTKIQTRRMKIEE